MAASDYYLRYWICDQDHSQGYGTVLSPVDENDNAPDSGPDLEVPEHLWAQYWPQLGLNFPDYIAFCGAIVISERAADALSGLNYVEGTKFVPTTIVTENKEAIGSCISIYFPEYARDVIDLERSGFNHKAVLGYQKRFTKPPFIRMEMIDNLDFFVATRVPVVCSERFRQAVLKANLTNFVFEEAVVG